MGKQKKGASKREDVQKSVNKGDEGIEINRPRCLEVAEQGIQTGSQFAALMAALMADVIEGRVNAQTANAACNAGGKLLKVVEMQIKYAKRDKGRTSLNLLNPADNKI